MIAEAENSPCESASRAEGGKGRSHVMGAEKGETQGGTEGLKHERGLLSK